MGKIITVRKVRSAEAVLITSDEEEALVREWLAEYIAEFGDDFDSAAQQDFASTADLESIKENRMWVLRDEGSKMVYVVPAADFLEDYEEVNEADIEPLENDLKFLESFTFEDNDG